MRQFFLLVTLSFLFLSCTNDTAGGNELLSQPPYDQLTDSIIILPGNADLYYKRGSLLYINNHLDEAERDLRTAWRIDPQESYALGITTILRKKNSDSALLFLQEASKKLPNSISVLIGLARAYQQKLQLDSAGIICDAIISYYPGQLDALLLKSELLKQQNKENEALVTLEKAYEYAPGDPELVHTLAFEYAEAKNKKVLALADSLIRADTEKRHAEPYYFKGVFYANTGNYNEAIKQFDEAIRHDFNFLEAYLNKGIAYYDQEKFDDAIQTFQLGIKVDPSFADNFYWLGKTMEAKGNKAEAKLNYLKAFGLDKTMVEAKKAADRL